VRAGSILLNLVRGFLMGSADVVPGVSGGTNTMKIVRVGEHKKA
jgi:uncharacterized membrane protein